MKKIIFILILSLGAVVESRAGIYKCTDTSGHTNYQAAPCTEDHKAVEINTKTGNKVDLNTLQQQKIQQEELQMQQLSEQQAAEQARLTAIEQRKQAARAESDLTQTLIKQNPTQYSAFAIPPYWSEKLPAQVKPFEERLPEIEKFRRLAAQKALATGQCQRVEADELDGKSSKAQLVFMITCSSDSNFVYNESELSE